MSEVSRSDMREFTICWLTGWEGCDEVGRLAVLELDLGLKTNLGLPTPAPATVSPTPTEGEGDGWDGDDGDRRDSCSDGNPGVRPGLGLGWTEGVTGDRVLVDSRFLLS